MFNFLRNCHCFVKWLYHLYSHWQWTSVPLSSHSWQHLWHYFSFISFLAVLMMEPKALDMLGKHSTTARLHPSLVSIIALLAWEGIHHYFTCIPEWLMILNILSFAYWTFVCSFEEVCIQIFCPVFNWIVIIAEF